MRRAVGLAAFFVAVAAMGQTAPFLRGYWYQPTQVVALYWAAVPGATQYRVYKSTAYPTWVDLGAVPATFNVFSLPANTAAVYQVQPETTSGPVGPVTNRFLVTTYSFTDEPIVAASTKVRSVHITDLRTVINAARSAAGLQAATWARPNLTIGDSVNAQDVTELRTAFDAALQNIGLTSPAYIDPVLGNTVAVKRDHIEQLRERARSIPEHWAGLVMTVSNPVFSPNGDGQKDTTTFSGQMIPDAGTMRTDVRWIVNVRNGSGTLVRSVGGTGQSVSYAWDGRNGSGVVQPEGTYTFELVDVDGLSVPLVTASTIIDVTAPAVSITAPTSGQASNVTQNGSTDLTVSGSATDAHFQSWALDQVSPLVSIAAGTSAVSPAATLGTWHTLNLANGSYVIRLSSTDQAGNVGTATVNMTVANFSVSQNVYQLNAAASGSVTYTSIVPFTLTETLTIKNAAGTTVRTLFNGVRAAGTYQDVWDGKDDSAVLVGDGVYREFATATSGTSSMTWDDGNRFMGSALTQLPYPKCRNDANALVDCNDATLTFDPYTNKPLRVNYCVDGGTPPSCTGSVPHIVVGKAVNVVETDEICRGSDCFLNEYQASGAHEVLWYGRSVDGTFLGNATGLTMIRRNDTWPRNVTLVYGTAPAVSNFTISALIFNPAGPTAETFTMTATTFQSRPVTIKGEFRNLTSNSILRTFTTASQPAGTVTLSWNGRADNGAWVAPALYEATITVTDSAGGSVVLKPVITVRYE